LLSSRIFVWAATVVGGEEELLGAPAGPWLPDDEELSFRPR